VVVVAVAGRGVLVGSRRPLPLFRHAAVSAGSVLAWHVDGGARARRALMDAVRWRRCWACSC